MRNYRNFLYFMVGTIASTTPAWGIVDAAIAMSGRDVGKITRIQIDTLPKEAYAIEPGNRGIEIRFTNLPGKLSADDLPAGGAGSRIKSAEVKEEPNNVTLLKLNYNCDCQAEVYDWQRKKLVIDIFSNEAVRNPDKMKEIAKSKIASLEEKKLKVKPVPAKGDEKVEEKQPPNTDSTTTDAKDNPKNAEALAQSTEQTANTPTEISTSALANNTSGASVSPADERPVASQQNNNTANTNTTNAGAPTEAQQQASGVISAPNNENMSPQKIADEKLRQGLRSVLTAAQSGGVVRFKNGSTNASTATGTSIVGGGLQGASQNGGGTIGGGQFTTGNADDARALTTTESGERINGTNISGGGALAGTASQSKNEIGTGNRGNQTSSPNNDTNAPHEGASFLNDAAAEKNNNRDAKANKAQLADPKKFPTINTLSNNVRTYIPGEPIATNDTSKCLPDNAFSFKLPTDQSTETQGKIDFYDELTKYKGNLVTEFDRTDPEAALQLAQYYTSFGMGDEAIGILKSFSVPEQRGQSVRDLAELFTDLPPSLQSKLNVGDACEGTHRIWSAYWHLRNGDNAAAARIAQHVKSDVDFEAMPRSLQTHVGGDLALNLARHKYFSDAEKMIEKVAQRSNQYDPKVLLVRGMIEGEQNNAHETIKILNTMVNANTDNNPEARLALAELKLSQNMPLSEDDMSSLEEIAFLHSRQKEGAQATALIAEHYAQKKDIYGAFMRLSHSRYNAKETDNPILKEARSIFTNMADKGFGLEDPQNSLVYWDYPHLIPPEPALIKAFAQKLHAMGHTLAANDILQKTRTAFPQAAVATGIVDLESKGLLKQNNPTTALQLLQQYPPNSSLALKINTARAYIQKGEPQKAVDSLQGMTQPEIVKLRAEAAWISRDWNTASKDYNNTQIFGDDATAKLRAQEAQYMQTQIQPKHRDSTSPDVAVKDAAKTIEIVKKALRNG